MCRCFLHDFLVLFTELGDILGKTLENICIMKRNNLISALTGILLIALQSSFAQVSNYPLVIAKADTLLQQGISFGEVVGWTAGIYADGNILWEGGAGYLDRENDLTATPQMIHRTASIAKPMTAIAILQLVEQGKIQLDEPIQTYVPEFPKKPEGKITVRHLLTHTSGINAYKNRLDGISFKEYNSHLHAMEKFQDRDLVGEPGNVYQYTTYGYVVLGAIIEKVSGMRYEDYMKQNIWEPAGMLHTSPEKHKVEVENKSKLYKRKKGKLKDDINTNISVKVAGGGLQTTAGDLLRFGEAVISNKLIEANTLEMMLQDPGIRPKEAGNPYGMGWFLYNTDPDNRIIGHSGAQAGTSTQLLIMPDQGIVIACLSNTRGSYAWGLTWQLLELVQNPEALEQPLMKRVELPRAALDKFVGSYDFGKSGTLKIKRKGDQLYSYLNQFKGLKLYPASKNMIFYRNIPAYFNFEFDDQGEIVKTSYTQDGKTFHPKKIE